MALKPTSQHLLRCKWAPCERFATPYLLRVARGVAEALQHCHARSVCHGDVYAHNVLVDEEGNATLCDFGTPNTKPRQALLLHCVNLIPACTTAYPYKRFGPLIIAQRMDGCGFIS